MAQEKEKTVAAKLTAYVHITDQTGAPAAFGPDDEVPEWAAKKMGAHCFEGGVHPVPVPEPEPEPAKKS